ncbi:DUF6708 domain-containing protein [Achromobacter sp. NPDC058515]|uniref:DUF6708 domain-containing protein n=1 Tax=Achromobacter sp. NPDC058515 TaxID=3346533 RepID=UPI0036475767
MKNITDLVKRLPSNLLIGATRFSREQPDRRLVPTESWFVGQALGVRRVNDRCVELEPYGNLVRNVYASSVGVLFVMGAGISAAAWAVIPSALPLDLWLILLLFPWLMAAFGGVMYLCTRNLFGRFRGGFIRINRRTRKLYFVPPRDEHLMSLDWDDLEAMAGYIPIVSQAGYTSRHPLYLIGVDWDQTPPKEICVSCGNLGWRDNGESARQLWDYLQIFMGEGPEALPKPPPVPPRLSRGQTFLRVYRDWAAKFRRDLSTPKGKRWSPLLVPAKLLWLVCMTFPDSLAEVIEYDVPYTAFPKEIDELCGFVEKRTPVMRLNGERLDQ